MTTHFNLQGTLKLDFKSNWGISDPNPLSGIDVIVRQVPKVDNEQDEYDLNNQYAILGSSLKGTLRSVAMKLADTSCNTAHKKNDSSCDKNNPCIVCSVFGKYSYRPAKIRLGSVFIDPQSEKVKINKLTHVSIDRKSKTNVGQGLYSELKIAPYELEVPINAYHLTKEELNLLKGSLELWGNFGLGKNHVPFNVKGIDNLDIEQREESL